MTRLALLLDGITVVDGPMGRKGARVDGLLMIRLYNRCQYHVCTNDGSKDTNDGSKEGPNMATQTQVSDPRAGRVADASEPDREEQRVAVLQRVFRQIIDNERRVGGEAVKKIAAAFNGEPPNG